MNNNKIIKYDGIDAKKEITNLYRKIIASTIVPADLKTRITSPIFKKGAKNIPTNYKGITLLISSTYRNCSQKS